MSRRRVPLVPVAFRMNAPAPDLYVGLMSGTSLDGIDAALVEFAPAPRLLGSHFVPYPPSLRDTLLELHRPGKNELDRAARVANELADRYADATLALLQATGVSAAKVTAIGCHGQTVRHRPDAGYSVQLCNGARLAERSGITAVIDFRSRDLAAGGQGAPLVPAFHAACFRSESADRAVLNLGGIANLTFLPARGAVTGFDTGPGNMLLDAWMRDRWNEDHDAAGTRAAGGTVDNALLASMLRDPYFALPPPKSTGRDTFDLAWLRSHVTTSASPQDVLATLAELTARSVADALGRHCAPARELFVCGGGVHNLDLMRRLRSNLEGRRVESTDSIGIAPDWVEAIAFAWLARCALLGETANLPEVTGAAGPRILGAIYPGRHR